MPAFRVTGGVLRGTLMSDAAYPDNTLPGIEGPVDPGYGISSDRPSHPIYLPPYPSQGPGFPTHPIVIPPDAIGPGLPTHPIYLPVYPSHPIVIPPDSIGPGVPTHPIYLPVYPAHPIVIPPNAVGPGLPTHPIVLPPEPPLGIWGGPWLPPYPSQGPGFPTHPIVIPPEAIVPEPDGTAHVVVYYGGQRITFTVDMTPPVPPTEATPKR